MNLASLRYASGEVPMAGDRIQFVESSFVRVVQSIGEPYGVLALQEGDPEPRRECITYPKHWRLLSRAMIHVYIAHRLSGPNRAENIEAAGRLMAALADKLPIVPVGSWITLARYWPETMREKGLAIDREQISRCDEFWMTGPEITSGMRFEGECAETFKKATFDLTNMTADAIEQWWKTRTEAKAKAKAVTARPTVAEMRYALLQFGRSNTILTVGFQNGVTAKTTHPKLERLIETIDALTGNSAIDGNTSAHVDSASWQARQERVGNHEI
jgi:hypothetical protein